MFSARYGCVHQIASKTGHRCHLCHGDVDPATYGLLRAFGRDTATVDHLEPQSFGGGDEPENLLIAHHGCNSSRGTRDVTSARLQLAGRPWRPPSSDEKAALALGLPLAAGGAAGVIFAKTDTSGQPVFNREAAVVGALLGLFAAIAA